MPTAAAAGCKKADRCCCAPACRHAVSRQGARHCTSRHRPAPAPHAYPAQNLQHESPSPLVSSRQPPKPGPAPVLVPGRAQASTLLWPPCPIAAALRSHPPSFCWCRWPDSAASPMFVVSGQETGGRSQAPLVLPRPLLPAAGWPQVLPKCGSTAARTHWHSGHSPVSTAPPCWARPAAHTSCTYSSAAAWKPPHRWPPRSRCCCSPAHYRAARPTAVRHCRSSGMPIAISPAASCAAQDCGASCCPAGASSTCEMFTEPTAACYPPLSCPLSSSLDRCGHHGIDGSFGLPRQAGSSMPLFGM